MIDESKLNTAAILRYYALANTPRYLYRHLRSEPSVQELADSSTPGELLRAISAREANPDRTAQDVAVAYAMLVALSFQDYKSSEDALANWHPKALAWASDIISIISHTTIFTQVRQFNAPAGRIIVGPQGDNTPSTIREIR